MLRWLVLGLAVAVAVNAAATPHKSSRSSKDLADDADKYLLPWNVRPINYDLTLYTHIERFNPDIESSFEFMGIVEIEIQILYGDISEVVIHKYDDVEIVSANIVLIDGDPETYTIDIGDYDSETNKQTLPVNPDLRNSNRYLLTLYYIGQNSNRLSGFYRSSYQDSNDETKWLVTTQFESFGARQAFPCFDEPEYKATFKLTVHYNETLVEQGYKAFFNTEIEKEEIRNGIHVTTFKTTPRPISTYLVAFIVAPYEISPEPAYFNSSFIGENGTKPLQTIGQPKYFSPKRQDLLSQVAGPAALNAMTKFTGVGFGLDKVEQAGIPDFSAGAMENWGLVTYREPAIFFNNETGTTSQKQSIVSTVTHELAHQWFGDLVTLHWWSDVWLNEGFATYFATHAADTYREPDLDTSDWNLIGQFVSGTLENALRYDSIPRNSRALTSETYIPSEIDSFFDAVSYDKGGSIIRMWRHAIGTDNFYAGLNRYLRQQEENVGTPEILLASFDGTIDALPPSERPVLPGLVADLFYGWHAQPGYPLISVGRQGGVLTLTQERFLSASDPNAEDNRFNVPVSYSTNLENNFNDTSPVAFLLEDQDELQIQLQNGSASWVVVNNQRTGYYRVTYDEENWEALFDVLNDPSTRDQIHEYNRVQIINDAASLGISTNKEYLSMEFVLKLLGTLHHEKSYVVWRSGIRAMNDILNQTTQADELTRLKSYFSTIVKPTLKELTLYVPESDSHERKLLRVEIANFAERLNLEELEKEAKILFKTRGLIHPDMRAVVFNQVVKSGDASLWESILAKASQADEPENVDLYKSLAYTQDSKLFKRLMKLLSTGNEVSDEIAAKVLSSVPIETEERLESVNLAIKERSWRGKPMKPRTCGVIC